MFETAQVHAATLFLTSGGPLWRDGEVFEWCRCRMSSIPSHAPRSVSIENQMPEDLFDAMREFIRLHPQWDQYRLMQAALAGFLFQHGAKDRAVARHYLDGLFHKETPESAPARTCEPSNRGPRLPLG